MPTSARVAARRSTAASAMRTTAHAVSLPRRPRLRTRHGSPSMSRTPAAAAATQSPAGVAGSVEKRTVSPVTTTRPAPSPRLVSSRSARRPTTTTPPPGSPPIAAMASRYALPSREVTVRRALAGAANAGSSTRGAGGTCRSAVPPTSWMTTRSATRSSVSARRRAAPRASVAQSPFCAPSTTAGSCASRLASRSNPACCSRSAPATRSTAVSRSAA